MDPYLGKKYKMNSSKNFDELMQFHGVDLVSRKTAAAVTPTCMLTRSDDGTYTFHILSLIRDTLVKFKLGEEFDESRIDGVKVKSVCTIEGNVLKQTQTESNGRKTFYERVFTDDLLTITITAEGWDLSCVRTFAATS